MNKLFPVGGLFKKLEQNGFHQPENQFLLAKIKCLFKNKFTLDGNKNFDYQEYLENAKNDFHQPEKPFPLARMKALFQKYVSTRLEKNSHWQECLKNG